MTRAVIYYIKEKIMAKLTQAQRELYDKWGWSNYCMADERKTIFDYKVLTESIKQEFLDIVKFALSPESQDLDWNDCKISSNQNFRYSSGIIRVITEFKGHRHSPNRRMDTINMCSFNYGELCVYSLHDFSKVHAKLITVFNNYCENELGFNSKSFYSNTFSNSYMMKMTIKSDLRDTLYALIPNNKFPTKYVLPGQPHTLRLSKKEGMIEYNHHQRVITMKIGKGVKKFFKIHSKPLEDESVKNISGRLSLKVSDFKLKIVSGNDIDKYYQEIKTDSAFRTGSLGNSCMRGCDAQDGNYFQVYKDNAKMLILHNEETDLIIGRAILWNNVTYLGSDNEDEKLTNGCSTLVMDRIYADESVYSMFKDWALENGYYRKRYQSYNNETLFRSPVTKEEIELAFSMDINLNEYGRVPYMDTFAWGDDDTVENEEGFGRYSARSTEGYLEGGDNDNSEDDDDDDDWDDSF
jgi:hypothetical protein